MQLFPDGTNPSVTKVINIIYVSLGVNEFDEVSYNFNNIFPGQDLDI